MLLCKTFSANVDPCVHGDTGIENLTENSKLTSSCGRFGRSVEIKVYFVPFLDRVTPAMSYCLKFMLQSSLACHTHPTCATAENNCR
jgi:hypothetical protein